MTVKTVKKSGKTYVYYICSTHKRFGGCKNNSVSGKDVERYTLLAIQNQIAGILSAEQVSGKLGLDALKSRKKAALESMIETSEGSIKEYNEYLVKSLAHMLDGTITKDEYDRFSADFLRRIDDTEKHMEYLREEIKRLSDDGRSRELVERFKASGNITRLDRRALVGMVKAVIVHDGKDFEIRYRYASGLNDFSDYAENAQTGAAQERTAL